MVRPASFISAFTYLRERSMPSFAASQVVTDIKHQSHDWKHGTLLFAFERMRSRFFIQGAALFRCDREGLLTAGPSCHLG